ncbi:MAG TPA: hypothetical protein VN408_30965 [Actinoplanes sp.]|nr:hypothetical protein [Actinoplanes sp.]
MLTVVALDDGKCMKQRLASTLGGIAVAASLVLSGSPALAMENPPADLPATSQVDADSAIEEIQGSVFPQVQSETTDATEGRVAVAAAPKPFITDGDEAHISRTPPRTVSGHGWWKSISHPRGTKGKVTIQMQRQPYNGGAWTTVGTGSKTTYSGSGSANRAVARYTCNGMVGRAKYRTVIDVDIIGYADTNEKAVTPVQTLWCG